MKRIAIVGAGQAGLQLAIGLLKNGYEVTLFSDRPAADIRDGRVLSSQCMFDSSLETERDLGLDYWEESCPKVEAISFAVPSPVGGKAIDWSARLDGFAQSVDQRVKIPRWMAEFEKAGGELKVHEVGAQDLEKYTRAYDLVIVATGKGDLSHLFAVDAERSPYHRPQRALALTYVKGMTPREPCPAVCFNLIPNVGEYFVFPALTATGACEIMVFEGVPRGPMDCWDDVTDPAQHLARSKWILETFLPWEAARCADVELTDANGVLVGRLVPTVRKPVGTLSLGHYVLGMADAVVLNDPITGQGSNNAARCAETYLESILERGSTPADPHWMHETFDRYWNGYAKWVTDWTNLLLRPPAHVLKLMDQAGKIPAVAGAIVNGFDDPRTLFPWFMEAAEADAFIDKAAKEVADRFDRRDFRKALGQFATGVAVVTARGQDGRHVGMTVNSFSSVSLDPPLVLWSCARNAPSYPDFAAASHYAVNVLASNQHHLSRQFSTPLVDKFAGVACRDGHGSCPILEGTAAHFVCRVVKQLDGGDHVIFLGEVEQYTFSEREPLVFHSGRYRIVTRHPDLPE